MENEFIDQAFRSFELELPKADSFEAYLHLVIPTILPQSEDLAEKEYYVHPGGKPWQEFRDNENFHEKVLHFFNPNGEYLIVVNGNINKGKWKVMGDTNKMIIEQGNRNELWELAFLDSTFFILQKSGTDKLLILGFEQAVGGLEWRDYVELLFNKYRENESNMRTGLIIAVIIIAMIILFSLF